MAVDVKTLTIGSRVEYEGKRVGVALVREDGCICEYKDNGQDVVIGIGIEKNPIPITSDLLKELGFEFRDLGFAELWKRGNFDLEHKHHSVYWECKRGGANIEFLHELESLYYLIYETELIQD